MGGKLPYEAYEHLDLRRQIMLAKEAAASDVLSLGAVRSGGARPPHIPLAPPCIPPHTLTPLHPLTSPCIPSHTLTHSSHTPHTLTFPVHTLTGARPRALLYKALADRVGLSCELHRSKVS